MLFLYLWDFFITKFRHGKDKTDLPTSECICPYSIEKFDHSQFFTHDQVEYAPRVADREVLGPDMRKLEKSFKEHEKATKGGFIQFKIET